MITPDPTCFLIADTSGYTEDGPTTLQTIELEPTSDGTRVHFRLAAPNKPADRVTLSAMAADLEGALVASFSALTSTVEGEAQVLAGGPAEPALPRKKSTDGFLAGVTPIAYVA